MTTKIEWCKATTMASIDEGTKIVKVKVSCNRWKNHNPPHRTRYGYRWK